MGALAKWDITQYYKKSSIVHRSHDPRKHQLLPTLYFSSCEIFSHGWGAVYFRVT